MKDSTEIQLVESLISKYVYASDFYEIKDWSFDFDKKQEQHQGYNDCFCIVFIRSGNFHFDLATKEMNIHIGHVVVEKANYEYRLYPTTGQCSIFNFTHDFYTELTEGLDLKTAYFFSNPNMLSVLLNTSPEIDYYHYQIMSKIPGASKLELDTLMLSLVQYLAGHITNHLHYFDIPKSLKKNHINTIEAAKEYMNAKFTDNISLHELASHCCVSPFHFSRIFKQFTSYSPYQYLLNVRLKHAEMLLRNTTKPVADICFLSGFNSIEHFATMFKQRYKENPRGYRIHSGMR